MTKNNDDSDYAVDEALKEEMHCTRCGPYLGRYAPGSNATVPCPKCKESNMIDYTGAGPVIKRRRSRTQA